MDYAASLYDPIYLTLGVDGTIDIGLTAGAQPVRVIDKTIGVKIADPQNAEILRIQPAACVRMTEIEALGIALADVDDGTLSMNGKDWTIQAHVLLPAPTGEGQGELMLYLQQ